MSIEQKSCREKTFQLQSIANVTRCIDKDLRSRTLVVSSLDIQPEQSKNNNPARKKPTRQIIYRFFQEIGTKLRLSGYGESQ